MSTTHIVSLLIEERDRLNAAIQALQGAPIEETLDDRTMPDKVRPAVKKTPVPKKGGMSAAGRKAVADAAKKRWAAIRAGKGASVQAAPASVNAPSVIQRKRKPWTAAQRKAIGARTKAMWAAKWKTAAIKAK